MVTAEYVDVARKLVLEKPSTSYLQRKMLISFTDAMVLMDILEEEGIVSKPNSAGLRTLLVAPSPQESASNYPTHEVWGGFTYNGECDEPIHLEDCFSKHEAELAAMKWAEGKDRYAFVRSKDRADDVKGAPDHG